MLTADQQWRLAQLLANKARAEPPLKQKRLMDAARLFAHLSIHQREHPEQAQTEPWPIEKILQTIAGPNGHPRDE
jgi:hypothetical protein